jgi:hypothetical protein
MWLWISGLAKDDYNDWIETIGNDWHFPHGATFFVKPGNFRAAILRRLIAGQTGEVVLFRGPQTEYHFLDSIIVHASTDRDDEILNLGINFTKVTTSYSGSP